MACRLEELPVAPFDLDTRIDSLDEHIKGTVAGLTDTPDHELPVDRPVVFDVAQEDSQVHRVSFTQGREGVSLTIASPDGTTSLYDSRPTGHQLRGPGHREVLFRMSETATGAVTDYQVNKEPAAIRGEVMIFRLVPPRIHNGL